MHRVGIRVRVGNPPRCVRCLHLRIREHAVPVRPRVMGFGIGFSAAVWLTDGQDTSVRVLVGLAVGGIGAFILFSLVRFTLYIAGGILGLIVAVVVGALFEIFGPDLNNVVGTIIAIAGIGLGGYFGSRLGNLIVLLASAAAGAYLIIAGLRVLYEDRIGGDVADPTE